MYTAGYAFTLAPVPPPLTLHSSSVSFVLLSEGSSTLTQRSRTWPGGQGRGRVCVCGGGGACSVNATGCGAASKKMVRPQAHDMQSMQN